MSYQEDRFTEIADSIRVVDGTIAPILATDFATRIEAIPTAISEEKTATVIDEAQEVTPSIGKLLSNVLVPPTRSKTRLAELVDGSIEVVAPSEFEGITSIGSYAFWNRTSLTSITIPSGVTSIGYEAFRNCSSLTSITIPDSVTSIGDWAFYNCSSLTSITIPSSVTSIGPQAFNNLGPADNSAYVACLATTPPTIGSSSFGNRTYKIHLPTSSETAYSTSTNWSTLYSEGRLVFDL